MANLTRALRVLPPFALYGLAREVDAACGVLLHTSLDLQAFPAQALALVSGGGAARAVLAWTAAGAALWLALAAGRARSEGRPFAEALGAEAHGFEPLLLRPALTVLALIALAVQPTYPYGFTLPVALTQDWAVAQDAAALAALVAVRAPRLRLPAPGAASLGLMAFLAYGLMTPESARPWDGHPGNEPKTLRMAVALGHGLTLDVEGVSARMEDLPVRPLGLALRDAAATALRESGRMLAALGHGPRALGAGAIQATRVTRQTIHGKEGGVFHVLAPGTSLLLAPALRLDRALNLADGGFGRLRLTLLLWNLAAAALVSAVFLLLRDATGRPGLAAALAGVSAVLPPFVFYSFQFYPEMLGALALAVALRLLLFVRPWGTFTLAAFGALLAVLPWLHQKFLPVWALLTALAVWRAVDEMVPLRGLLLLAVPQALTVYLTALYNFAITGSARPDALFLAWGPGGVTTARMGQGLLGLLLDARYGLLPYVPLFLCAAGGLALGRRAGLRLALAAPVAAVYYVTVAAADNWSGAVCNLGRYVMPAVPFLLMLAAAALAMTSARRGALAVVLALGAWSLLLARALWRDPHAANDCALLLGRSAFADGNVYLPNLFLRSWSDGAPGLAARVVAWLGLLALLGLWLRRAALGRGGVSPPRALAGLCAVVLAVGLVLERWPSPRTAPAFSDAIAAGPGVTVFPSGPVRVEDERVHASGDVDLLVRSREPLPALALLADGQGTLRLGHEPPVILRGRAVELQVPLEPVRTLTGRRGVGETLARATVQVETGSEVVLRVIGN
ncbi:MAG TPA: hypothetical protein VF310_09310, partial [Vicinamibacteria bacterium]